MSSTKKSEETPKQVTSPSWHDKLGGLGPGLVTGASDDDPSGIVTYAQTGAQFGFSMLWLALLTYPLMAGVHEICDRTALATGKGLGELIVLQFARRWRVVIGVLVGLLIVANVLNIPADLMAVGAGMNLLHAGPPLLWSLLAGAILITLLHRVVRVRVQDLENLVRGAAGLRCGAVLHKGPLGERPHLYRRSASATVEVVHRGIDRRVGYDYLTVPLLLAGNAPGRGDARGTIGWSAPLDTSPTFAD